MENNWIYGIIAASAVCALCCALTPEGKVKNAAEFVFGIVMIVAMLQPLNCINFKIYSISAEKYKLRAEELVASGEETRENLDRRIIEAKYEAYILDKAEKSGVGVSEVSVLCSWSSDGFWYPESVEVILCADDRDGKCLEVKKAIESELGIDIAQQTWRISNESS